MIKFLSTDIVDKEKYAERLRGKGLITVDPERLKSLLNYNKMVQETKAFLAEMVMKERSAYKYITLDKTQIISYLTEFEGCKRSSFDKRDAKTDVGSLDSSKILEPLLQSGKATEFLDNYISFSSMKSQNDRIASEIKKLVTTDLVTRDGVPLSYMRYNVNEKENLRHYYKDSDLISIPKHFLSAFTVKDGKFLVWADFSSADFNYIYNNFIKSEYTIPAMSKYPRDRYAGFMNLLCEFEGIEFDYEGFKEDRTWYKEMILSILYHKTNGVNKREVEMIKRVTALLKTFPRYQELLDRIQQRLNLKLAVNITAHFGFTQPVSYSTNENDVINKAMNTPAQTTTSEMVILYTNTLLDRLYDLGYTEDDAKVYMVRHDEIILELSEKVKKDLWVLKDMSEIIVDFWDKQTLQFKFGYRYEEEDESLYGDYLASCKLNEDKIQIVYPSPIPTEREVVYPTKKTFIMSIGYRRFLSTTVLCFYSEYNKEYMYMRVDSVDNKEIFNNIVSMMVEKEQYFLENDYSAVFVKSELGYGDFFPEKLMYSFVTSSDKTVIKAHNLADDACAKLFERESDNPHLQTPEAQEEYQRILNYRRSNPQIFEGLKRMELFQ